MSEVDAVTPKWVRPVAQNSKRRKYGVYVHNGKGSFARLARTSHGNKTFFNFK